jgi:transposase
VFKVSPTTLQKWKRQLKETGTLAPKKRVETCRKIEPSRLKKYIEENPDGYLREIAAEFGCSNHAVEKALARLKLTRKKNDSIPREM